MSLVNYFFSAGPSRNQLPSIHKLGSNFAAPHCIAWVPFGGSKRPDSPGSTRPHFGWMKTRPWWYDEWRGHEWVWDGRRWISGSVSKAEKNRSGLFLEVDGGVWRSIPEMSRAEKLRAVGGLAFLTSAARDNDVGLVKLSGRSRGPRKRSPRAWKILLQRSHIFTIFTFHNSSLKILLRISSVTVSSYCKILENSATWHYNKFWTL